MSRRSAKWLEHPDAAPAPLDLDVLPHERQASAKRPIARAGASHMSADPHVRVPYAEPPFTLRPRDTTPARELPAQPTTRSAFKITPLNTDAPSYRRQERRRRAAARREAERQRAGRPRAQLSSVLWCEAERLLGGMLHLALSLAALPFTLLGALLRPRGTRQTRPGHTTTSYRGDETRRKPGTNSPRQSTGSGGEQTRLPRRSLIRHETSRPR